MSREYGDTLALFKKGTELSAIAVSHFLDIEQGAAMMRLSRLTVWGFLNREGTRREYIYSAVEKHVTKPKTRKNKSK